MFSIIIANELLVFLNLIIIVYLGNKEIYGFYFLPSLGLFNEKNHLRKTPAIKNRRIDLEKRFLIGSRNRYCSSHCCNQFHKNVALAIVAS